MEGSFIQKYGPWGVVTGGTRGIGKAFAESLASRGLNVVIIGTRDVKEVAEELAVRFQVQTKPIQAELGDPNQVDRIMEECQNLSVGLFCCNHASTNLFPEGQSFRRWLDTSEEDLDAMLQINLASSAKLLYRFAQRMRPLKKRRTDHCLFKSSANRSSLRGALFSFQVFFIHIRNCTLVGITTRGDRCHNHFTRCDKNCSWIQMLKRRRKSEIASDAAGESGRDSNTFLRKKDQRHPRHSK